MSKARDIASAAPAPSTVSATELGYVDGVTSAIQTQLDAKTAKSTLTTTGDIYYASAANTPARLGIGSTDQVLKVTGGVPAWATPAAGGDTFTAGKNKIINGAMQVAQRGTSFNFASGGGTKYYSADRWFTENYQWSAGSNLTVSNDSSVYPDGFSRSIKVATGATALTLGSGGNIYLQQFIEGHNIASLYKSSNVTLSFYVRSSVTGTYSVLFTNGWWGVGSATRGLIKEYTVNTANTWERKTITIDLATGTSSGTWNTDSSIGLSVQFNLGANANRVGNDYLNTWATWSDYEVQSTSSVQWTSNANATFYLTGVQLEEGSTATSFQTATGTIQGELAACQRYYFRFANTAAYSTYGTGWAESSTDLNIGVQLPIQMRVTPTSVDFSNIQISDRVNTSTPSSLSVSSLKSSSLIPYLNISGVSGLTQYRPYEIRNNNNSAGYVGFSAEL